MIKKYYLQLEHGHQKFIIQIALEISLFSNLDPFKYISLIKILHGIFVRLHTHR